MEKNLRGFYEETIEPHTADSIEMTYDILGNLANQVKPPKKDKIKDIRFYMAKIAQLLMFGGECTLNVKYLSLLMKDKSYKMNRTGFLFLSLILNSNPSIAPELFDLITAMLFDQKRHKNYLVGLALSAISVCPTAPLVSELGHHVADIARNPNINEWIRTKALLTLVTFFRETKIFCSTEQLVRELPALISSEIPSLILGASKLACILLENNQIQQVNDIFVSTIKALSYFVLSESSSKNKATDLQKPQTVSELFKVLKYKEEWDDNELSYMTNIAAKLLNFRKVKREPEAEISFLMAYSEGLRCCSKIKINQKAQSKIVNVCLTNLNEDNTDMYLFSLESILNIVNLTDEYNQLIFSKRGLILKPIHQKIKVLDALALKIFCKVSVGSEEIAESILSELSNFVGPWVIDEMQSACAEVILRGNSDEKVFIKCVDILMKGTKDFGKKFWVVVADFVEKHDNFQKSALEYCLRLMQNYVQQPYLMSPAFIMLTANLAGNYGHLCDCGPNSVIETIAMNFDSYDSICQAMVITAMVKISTRVPELRAPAINYLSEHLSSNSTEVVQRCREGALCLLKNDIILKKSLSNPKYTGIVYEFRVNPVQQLSTGGIASSPFSSNSDQTNNIELKHYRKGSDGQWNPSLIMSPSKRAASDHRFDVHENSPKQEVGDSQLTLEPISGEDDPSLFQTMATFGSLTGSIDMTTIPTDQANTILAQFLTEDRGKLYDDGPTTVYAMIEKKLPVITITYKIQNNGSMPISADDFHVDEVPGLQFVFGERPNIIPANNFVIIRDHLRPTSAFDKIPVITASFNGWECYFPVPVLNRMFAAQLDVDQQTFVERWQFIGEDMSIKEVVSNDALNDAEISTVMDKTLGWAKLNWSPESRPAFIGGYKISSGNVGILIVFNNDQNNQTHVEIRATEKSMLQPLVNIIKNEILELL